MERQTSMKTSELAALREAIDGVDDAIARLLVARHRLARKAIAVKLAAKLPVYDCSRERLIRARYSWQGRGLARVAAAITQWCRDEP